VNPLLKKAIQTGTLVNVMMYRRTNGRLGGRGLDKLPLLLLTAPGRKTGTPRTVPVAYFPHDAEYIVVGTGRPGSKQTPQWFLNLQAAGHADIRIREQEHDVDVRVSTGDERNQLWAKVAGRSPQFAKFQERIGRTQPIAVLTARSRPA